MSRDLLSSLARLLPPLAQTKGQPLQLPQEDIEKALSAYCSMPTWDPASGQAPPRIPDAKFKQIAALLRSYKSQEYGETSQWYTLPRIYAILRAIQCLDKMCIFVAGKFTDYMMPFESAQDLPDELGEKRADFLTYQSFCLTTAVDIEKGIRGKHVHFNKDADIHFLHTKPLGNGGQGHVDVVWSRLSLQQFARKRFYRANPRSSAESFKSFEREIAVLKRLSHRHLVKIMGSYTDPRSFAFLMQPVGDCNLKTYLQTRHVPQQVLRSFYGCLANAVTYLHGRNIHHMDIKPENILIKRSSIFLTDFGTAHDWSGKERSTTWSAAPKTPRYMPPEVSRNPGTARNYATDMWSLGVVFLEIATVLRGETLTNFHRYLQTHGTKHQFVYGNPPATYAWMEVLRKSEVGPDYDNVPLSWVKDMIEPRPGNRPVANSIREQTLHQNSAMQYCGFCCIGEQSLIHQQPTPAVSESGATESVLDAGDFTFEDNQVQDPVDRLDEAKTYSINSWIKNTPEFANLASPSRRMNEEESLPFDVTYDDAANLDQIPEGDQPEGIPARFAEFDILATPKLDFNQPASVSVEDHELDLPFDVENDDSSSDVSTENIPGDWEPSEKASIHLETLFEQLEEAETEGFAETTSESCGPAPPYSLAERTVDYERYVQDYLMSDAGGLDRQDVTAQHLPIIVEGLPCIAPSSQIMSEALPHVAQDMSNSPEQMPQIAALVAIPNLVQESDTVSNTQESGGHPDVLPAKLQADVTGRLDPVDEQRHEVLSEEKAKELPTATSGLPVPQSVPLTSANLKKATRDPSRHVVAKKYLQEIRNTQSSAATSIMSEGTRKRLSHAGAGLAWQDSSMRLLDNFCGRGKAHAVRACLEAGCNPGTKKKPRPGPLLKAVKGGTPQHAKCVKALLGAGADVDIVSKSTGKTALHLAIEHPYSDGYVPLIWILLQAGANPNISDFNGDYPILQILYGGYEPLEKHRRDALYLLCQPDFSTDVNIRPPGTLNMPLHLAVRRKDPWAVGVLLEKGADVNTKNGSGLTPFAMAANAISSATTEDEEEVMRLLLQEGAKIDEKIGVTGRTAVQLAVDNNREDLAEMFKELSPSHERTHR